MRWGGAGWSGHGRVSLCVGGWVYRVAHKCALAWERSRTCSCHVNITGEADPQFKLRTTALLRTLGTLSQRGACVCVSRVCVSHLLATPAQALLSYTLSSPLILSLPTHTVLP